MSGQRKAPYFRSAAVQHVKQDALALLHPHRLSMPQHAPIDGERFVLHLVSLGHAFRQRSLHRARAGLLEYLVVCRRKQKILSHVTATAEPGFEFLQHEKHLAVVSPGLFPRFDVRQPNFAAVLPRRQVCPRAIMRVIEPQS